MSITAWDRLGEGGRNALSGAAFLAAASAFVCGVFLYPENLLVAGADYQLHHVFLKTYWAESLQAGKLPLWNPYINAGRPFAADPQTAVFYPLHLIYAVLPLTPALVVLSTLHVAAAGFFCFLLARALRISVLSALLSGVAFMFGGFVVGRLYRGQLDVLESLAYLPLLLCCFERADRTRRWQWFVWAGVGGALQFLAGSPQVAWMTWVTVGVYVLARRAVGWREGRWRALARMIGGGLLATAVTAALAAVQILPSLELARLSVRGDRSVEFSAAYAFAPPKLIHLLFPDYYTITNVGPFDNDAESAGYVGLIGLVLALLGVLQSRNRRKWVLLAVAAFSGAIMFGRETPLFEWLYRIVPGMSAFRIHARFVLVLSLCLALWAGMGADAIWRSARAALARRVGLAVAVSLVLLMGTTAWALSKFLPTSVANFPALWPSLLLGVLTLGAMSLVWFAERRAVQTAWLVLLCLDLVIVSLFNDRFRVMERESFGPPASEAEILQRMEADEGLFRFALPSVMVRANSGVLAHISGVNGFGPLSLNRYYRFVHAMTWQALPDRRTHTPAEGVFQPDDSFPFKVLNVRYSVRHDAETGRPALVSRHEEVPRAFLVWSAEIVKSDEAALEAMRSPDFDPRALVLFDHDPGVARPPSRPDPENHVRIVSYAPDAITLSAELQSDAFLVLSEINYPGWRAYVDDEQVPIQRADYLLRAVLLKAGRHDRIEFRFEPRSLAIGAWISLGGVIFVLAALVLSYGRTRRRTVPPTAPDEPTDVADEPPSHRQNRLAWVQVAVVLIVTPAPWWFLKQPCAKGLANLCAYFSAERRTDIAEPLIERAAVLCPNLDVVQLQLGATQARGGELDSAIEHLRRALELNPRSSDAANVLAKLLLQMGQTADAVEYARRAVEINPSWSQAHVNLGRALIAVGRLDAAEAELEQAVALNAGSADVYVNVARILHAAGLRERAMHTLQLGLQRLPDSLALRAAVAQMSARGAESAADCPTVSTRTSRRANG